MVAVTIFCYRGAMIGRGLVGIGGRPYVDLEPFVDLDLLASLDDEICYALAQIPTDYTGGGHRSMGIMPACFAREPWADYGEVIRAMTDREFLVFASLSDTPHRLDPARRAEMSFGEERAIPLSRRQMLHLEMKHGVYFPWKVYVELMPGGRWEDKADPSGKRWTRDALVHFPRTVDFVRRLPFASVGSVKLLGLRANDHGTVHRDADPAVRKTVDSFITFSPGRGKRLFLWDDVEGTRTHIHARAYWFNDSDYHGVEADPWFRYSIRVDGAFAPGFLDQVLGVLSAGSGAPSTPG
jgi:hypothetical protein